MKKRLLLVCVALMSLMGASAQIPTNSTTNGSDVWYYIKGERGSTTTAVWATAKVGNTQVVNEEMTLSDAQLWKVVTNKTGIALKNKAFETYINADLENYLAVPTVATLPTCPLKFTLSASLTDAVIIENVTATGGVDDATLTFRLHAGGAGDGHGLVNYYDDIKDNVSFLFVGETAVEHKTALLNQITAANTLYTNSVAGTAPGQYPAQARINLFAAISTAQSVHGNATATFADSKNAISALLTAVDAFKNTVVVPMQFSTAVNPKWYYIQGAGTGVYSLDKSISVNPETSDLGWGNTAVTAGQLFRFESVTPITFRIVSALLPNGEMLSTQSPILYGASTNTAWTYEFMSGTDGNQYRIKSNGKILHAQADGDLVHWDANYNSASAWKFKAVDDATAKTAVTSSLDDALAVANALFSSTSEGTLTGQYPASARTALSTAISTASDISTNAATKTFSELSQAQVALQVAINQYRLTVIWAPDAITSTAANPVWYVFQVQATDGSRLGKLISYDQANNRPVGAVASPTASDNLMWRIECNLTTKKYAVVNKVSGASISTTYVANRAVCNASPNQDWNLTPIDGKTDVYKFVSAVTLHMTNTDPYGLMNYDGGDLASQFKAILASTFFSTGLTAEPTSGISVVAVNKMIVVTGTNAPVKAFTVSGSEVNATKALNAGIYIVKVAGKSFKLIVQ